jgi:Na+-transporting methylmalonyl-CoA/oxaloacetate decarboxylase gamma subunit
MVDWNLAFLISGAGYGINILVLVIISIIVWSISLVIKRNKKSHKK